MDPAIARIDARSRRQAMDWSLVLASQDIETALDYSEDGEGWGLLVTVLDYDRATEAIRLYQLENRRWPWRRDLFQAGYLFDWAALGWVALLVGFFWLGSRGFDLRDAGLMDGEAVAHGQWWRLFTAVWLHADIAHLATNSTIGFVLLGMALGRFGTGTGMLSAYLAGAGGNIVAWLLSPSPHYSLGASGLVMGALGLLAAQSLSLWRHPPYARKQLVSGLTAGAMLFILVGLTPGTDILAHAGGF